MKNATQSGVLKRNPLSYLFSKTWQYSSGNHQNIVIYWSMFIVGNIFILILHPLVLAKIMDTIQKNGINHSNIALLCGLLSLTLILNLIFWGFHGPARIIERCNAFKAKANYRKGLLKGVMTLPLDWHSDHHSGDTIDKIEKGTSALYNFSETSFEVIASFVQLMVSYAMLTYFSPPAAIIVLVMIGVTVWITMRFDKAIVRDYRDLNRAENHISESVYDAISNITTVIILRVERLVFEAIAKKIDKPFELYKKNSIRNETKWFMTSMCCSVMTVVVLTVYFFQHVNSAQGILIGSVYLLFNYLDKISELFFRFCGMYGDILQRKSKVNNAEELSQDFRPANFTNHVLPEDWKLIRVNGLNFSYHNGDRDGDGEKKDENGNDENVELHLDDVSFSIGRGERIALVGVSGSGKTTLLKIIRNLYHPQEIDLIVDGQAIPAGFDGICRAIALVPQDPEIFATTIRENITLGAEYDTETIRWFTDMACFTDVAESLPKKLDSAINEKGVNLSGGQRQRLALARGLLACEDKSVVLLDEPTSSIDIANEMIIYRNIFQNFRGKSIISSIHRLHLLPLFDRIYLFDKGRVIGSGSLDELLSSCPQFRDLWKQYSEHKEGVVDKVEKVEYVKVR